MLLEKMLIMQHSRLILFPKLKILNKYYKKTTYLLRFCFVFLYVNFKSIIIILNMIENYKGWDITLTWDEKHSLNKDSGKNAFNQKVKWKGVNLSGNSIYGASLKEIRHIIDYPGLHK